MKHNREGTVANVDEKRTWMYIDGFNFYYAIEHSDLPLCLAWCDFRALGEQFLISPGDKLKNIRYFTAPVGRHSVDGGEEGRQKIWLAAVRTIQDLDVTEGIHFRPPEKERTEKMTDVNIAVELILDRLKPNTYDQAIILSGDLDLFPAALAAKERLGEPKQVKFWVPPDVNYNALRHRCERHEISCSQITPYMLYKSRLPDTIVRDGETIRSLPCWRVPKNVELYDWARCCKET